MRILDAQGNAVVKYAYDPWGVPTIEGDKDLAAINPCSYRGYYYDEETGYYYLQSRYYDPAIGRFINADTYVSTGRSVLGSNMFSYCKNNPTNHVDATGHDGVYFSVNLLQLLGSALSAIMLGIQSGIASIKAAIASVAIPVICIAAAAVGIAAITWQCRSSWYLPKDFGDSTLQKEKIQLSIMPNFRETPPAPGSGRSRRTYQNAG